MPKFGTPGLAALLVKPGIPNVFRHRRGRRCEEVRFVDSSVLPAEVKIVYQVRRYDLRVADDEIAVADVLVESVKGIGNCCESRIESADVAEEQTDFLTQALVDTIDRLVGVIAA